MTLRYDQLAHLAEPLKNLSFEERTTIAHILGLSVGCCNDCGCYIGSADCHDPKSADGECTGEGACGCPQLSDGDDEEGDEDDDED
jgi:hypothetical protein